MRVTNLFLLSSLAFAQSDPLVQGLESFHKGDYVQAELRFRESLKRGDDERARAFLDEQGRGCSTTRWTGARAMQHCGQSDGRCGDRTEQA